MAEAVSHALSVSSSFSDACIVTFKPEFVVTLGNACAESYAAGAAAAASAFAQASSMFIQKGHAEIVSPAIAQTFSMASAFSTATASSLGGAFSSQPAMLCSAFSKAASQASASGNGSAFASSAANAGVSC